MQQPLFPHDADAIRPGDLRPTGASMPQLYDEPPAEPAELDELLTSRRLVL